MQKKLYHASLDVTTGKKKVTHIVKNGIKLIHITKKQISFNILNDGPPRNTIKRTRKTRKGLRLFHKALRRNVTKGLV